MHTCLSASLHRTRSELLDVLAARSGVIAAAGAGGKKTPLYRIAEAHPGRAVLTGTVKVNFSFAIPRIHGLQNELSDVVSKAADKHRKFFFAQGAESDHWLEGVPGAEISRYQRAASADVVLVKADGARGRDLKAPREGEPVYPTQVDTVLYIVSVRPVGHLLTDRWVHRIERFSAVTGARARKKSFRQPILHAF